MIIMICGVLGAAGIAVSIAFLVFRKGPTPSDAEPDHLSLSAPVRHRSTSPTGGSSTNFEPSPLPFPVNGWSPQQTLPAPTPTNGWSPQQTLPAPTQTDGWSPPERDFGQQSRTPIFSKQRHVVNLVYGDYCGEVSTRVVEVDSAWWAHDQCYFRGWCRLRDGWRTFRVDRVLDAWIDGECDRCDGWALIAHLRDVPVDPSKISSQAPGTPKRPKPKVERPPTRTPLGPIDVQASGVEQLTAMAFVLVYVARADGRFVSKEKEAIRPLLDSWSRSLGGVPPSLADLGQVHVDRNEFSGALSALTSAAREIKIAVLAGAVNVAETSAGVKEDEAVVLLEIEKELLGLSDAVIARWKEEAVSSAIETAKSGGFEEPWEIEVTVNSKSGPSYVAVIASPGTLVGWRDIGEGEGESEGHVARLDDESDESPAKR